MLFDLRGRHRRRAVKVIYIGLAVLIGLGLVGFGIGGGFGGGGLFNAATENEGSGGASFSNQIKKYEKTLRTQPTNVAAWEKLTQAQLHEAGGEAYVSASTGQPTAKGKELYARASHSWESYLALNPPKPNVELAKLMVTVYGVGGLNQPALLRVPGRVRLQSQECACRRSRLGEGRQPRSGEPAYARQAGTRSRQE